MPITTEPIAMVNAANRPTEQKKPIDFLSVYTKRKKLVVLAACLIVFIILAVVVAVLVIFVNPQQKNTLETSAT
jgi:hypothetical protein